MKISELPQEIKALAFLRQKECLSLNYDKSTDDLDSAFDWTKTKEKYDYWNEWDDRKFKTDKEKITDIIDNKIATMSSRGFESYYLPIGILKDLIREIKEIK